MRAGHGYSGGSYFVWVTVSGRDICYGYGYTEAEALRVVQDLRSL